MGTRLTADERRWFSKSCRKGRNLLRREKSRRAWRSMRRAKSSLPKTRSSKRSGVVAEALRFGVGRSRPDKVWREFGRREMIVRPKIGGSALRRCPGAGGGGRAYQYGAKRARHVPAPLAETRKSAFGDGLSAEQKAAVRHILKSRDQVIGVRGGAGSAETTAMSEAVKPIEASGLKVFAFAPLGIGFAGNTSRGGGSPMRRHWRICSSNPRSCKRKHAGK